MFREADRAAWLQGKNDAKTLNIVPVRSNYVSFDVSAEMDAVLVRSSAPIGTGKGKLDAVQMREENILTGKSSPIIPGSSIKGAMRDHMHRIAPFLGLEGYLDFLLGREPITGTDNGVAGKLVFSDATISGEQEQKATRIRMNRVTGGVIRGALFTEQPVSGTWRWSIRVPEDQPEGCLLVLYALRDLGLGLYQLGGTKAIGRGIVSNLTVAIHTKHENVELNVSMGQTKLTDEKGLVQRWEKAIGGVDKHEN